MAKKKIEEFTTVVETTYDVLDEYKDFTHIMVGSMLIPVIDGKVTVSDKNAVKDFVK